MKAPLKEKLKTLWSLFFTFFKIGAICFGGGYAMISIISKEIVEKKKWITEEEMLNILAVAEATPGPISINTSTYVGSRKAGILGALCSTFGVVLPSFIIIFTLSFFLDTLRSVAIIDYALRGMRAGVLALVLGAVIKMSKGVERTIFSLVIFLAVLAVCIFTDFYVVYIIIICATLGILYNFVVRIIRQRKDKKVATDKKGDSEKKVDADKEGDSDKKEDAE